MAYHEVEPNQTLPELVQAHAPHLTVEQVRSHSKNKGLFATRTDYLLRTGDKVWLPDEAGERTWFKVSRGESRVFSTAENLRPVKLLLRMPDGEPVRSQSFELELDGTRYPGTTDESGMMSVMVPVQATKAIVRVSYFAQTILIGGLEPISTIRGVQGRLANLGYQPGPVDGSAGPRTSKAIRAFQRNQGLTEDGVAGPETRDALRTAYGY